MTQILMVPSPTPGPARDRDFGWTLNTQACGALPCTMSELPDNHEVALRLAVLEECMKTIQADYKTDITMLGKQRAERDAEQMRRDKDNPHWPVGLWIAAFDILGALFAGLPDAPEPERNPDNHH